MNATVACPELAPGEQRHAPKDVVRQPWEAVVQPKLRAFQALLLWMAIAIALPSVLGTSARWAAAQEREHACECPMARSGAPCACPACQQKPDRLARLYGSLRDRCNDDHWIAPQAVDPGLMPAPFANVVAVFATRLAERPTATAPPLWDRPPPVPPPRLLRV